MIDPVVSSLRRRLESATRSSEEEHLLARLRHLQDRPVQAYVAPADLDDSGPWLAALIDHTALKPETTQDMVRELCAEAVRHGFASVCVAPCYASLAAELLGETAVAVCTVAGFPLGGTVAKSKVYEVRAAVRDGATEIDMVINVGMLKSGAYAFVEDDIRGVVEAVHSTPSAARPERPGLVKVILETALLSEEEKVIACVLARAAGADFVKTSTGFSGGGATVADVALMRSVVGGSMGVKAAGGIRSFDDARAMVAHGASRIGASASVAIVQGHVARSAY
jgi:deoxyribose-phosphate aldolase